MILHHTLVVLILKCFFGQPKKKRNKRNPIYERYSVISKMVNLLRTMVYYIVNSDPSREIETLG